MIEGQAPTVSPPVSGEGAEELWLLDVSRAGFPRPLSEIVSAFPDGAKRFSMERNFHMSLSCSHALLIALISLAPADGDQALKKLQGTWAPDSVESQGSIIDRDLKVPYNRQTYRIDQDNLTIFFTDVGTSVKVKLKINASVTPKQFDIVYPEGAKYIGIFAVDEDVLVVSLQWGGSKKRPKHFTTHIEDTEDRPIVYILRRQ